MSDLSNMHALQAGQQKRDYAEPKSHTPRHLTYSELEKTMWEQSESLTLLLAEARDAGKSLNRWAPCAGARILRICNEIEGVEDDE